MGHDAVLEICRDSLRGAVVHLVRYNDVQRLKALFKAADRRYGDNVGDAQLFHAIDIRPVIKVGRRIFVAPAMP
jgi:hypothetical protein